MTENTAYLKKQCSKTKLSVPTVNFSNMWDYNTLKKTMNIKILSNFILNRIVNINHTLVILIAYEVTIIWYFKYAFIVL